MQKTGEHMTKVKSNLLKEKRKMENAIQRRELKFEQRLFFKIYCYFKEIKKSLLSKYK